MTLTPKEAHRLHVLTLVESRRITTAQAAEALNLTPRQVRWLRGTLRLVSPEDLARGNRGRPSTRQLAAEVRRQILFLARGRYTGLNDVRFTEKLTAAEGLAISRATVRRILRAIGQTVGLPAAIYTDGHGIFVRNDPHSTLAGELQGYPAPTQVGRPLQALGIHQIIAERPQVKGRIQRLWNTFQDRLVAEPRLAGLTTLAAGDAFLASTLLPAFNAQFAVPPAIAPSACRPIPRGWDLERICAFHYARGEADVVPCLDGS